MACKVENIRSLALYKKGLLTPGGASEAVYKISFGGSHGDVSQSI